MKLKVNPLLSKLYLYKEILKETNQNYFKLN